MTKENIVTLTASPSEGTEAKRNKKTQLLSALLSASALGVFLEGCGAGGGNPDPVTPDPVTPDPVTPDPVTPDPVTPDPVTPDPVTPDPVTPDPVTPDPVTPDPVTPDPVTPDPVTPDPVTPDPVSSVTGDGSASNPFLATDTAEIITGSLGADWVSYAGSTGGVTVDLGDNPATVSGGWAAGDSLDYNIDNLIGSDYADTLTGDSGANSFEGGRGNDVLAGGIGIDTYVFNTGDGTDTITDSGGSIVFEQGTDNDYAGATYAFSNGDLKLTVTKGSETLNIIDFSEHPYAYTFTTRSGDTDTRIPTSDLVVPPRQGSESNPFLATDAADSFSGTGIYDWVSYAGSNAGVTIQLSRYSDATVSGGWAAGDSLDYNIDNLIGSDYADTLTGDSSANSFEGGRGNDVLAGGTGYRYLCVQQGRRHG